MMEIAVDDVERAAYVLAVGKETFLSDSLSEEERDSFRSTARRVLVSVYRGREAPAEVVSSYALQADFGGFGEILFRRKAGEWLRMRKRRPCLRRPRGRSDKRHSHLRSLQVYSGLSCAAKILELRYWGVS